MNLKSHVTSLEISKKLKELGVKQESLFYHVKVKKIGNDILDNELPFVAHVSQLSGMSEDWISAFTASELLELLPKKLNIDDFYNGMLLRVEHDSKYFFMISYEANYFTVYDEITQDENICNALAKMLIYLIENGLLDINHVIPPNAFDLIMKEIK